MTENLETGGRVFGPHDSMSWCACNLAWVFAAIDKLYTIMECSLAKDAEGV